MMTDELRAVQGFMYNEGHSHGRKCSFSIPTNKHTCTSHETSIKGRRNL